MDTQNITFPLAIAAGFLSFVSPCVLPLVPVYLGYLTGSTVGGEETPKRSVIFFHALAFVLGFTFIFVVVFGLPVGLLGQITFQLRPYLVKIGGLLLIIFGLHTAGLIKIPFLYMERRLQIGQDRKPGYLRSLIMGVTFAAGWTPCIGPILGAVIGLAYDAEQPLRAVFLLLAYSVGLGLPFLIVALLWTTLTDPLRKLNRHLNIVQAVSGIFLIIIGLLLLTDSFQVLNAFFLRLTPGWLIERL